LIPSKLHDPVELKNCGMGGHGGGHGKGLIIIKKS